MLPRSDALSPATPLQLNPPLPAKSGSRAAAQHAAGEFEALLLGQWLQAAQTSFATVPGGDDDQDAGDEQFKAMAVQALAKGLVAKGGIGLGHLVEGALQRETAAGASNRPTSSLGITGSRP